MVSFCSARKIRDYLVRCKLYLLERNVCSRKCKKSRHKVCNIFESTEYSKVQYQSLF